MMLQEQGGAKKALCFSPQKRSRLSDAMLARSPVSLSKFNLSKGQIFINNKTTITVKDQHSVPFEHNPKLAKDAIVTLKELQGLTSGQIVNIKASVMDIGEVITHQGKDGPINKQEVILRDSTNCRKLTLYGEDVDHLVAGESYLLRNLRLHIVKSACFLNTTLSAKFNCKKIKQIENLVDGASCQTDVQSIARIVGVKSIYKSTICPACNKRCVEDGGNTKCENCKCMISADCCKSAWFLSIMVKDLATDEVLVLSLKNDQVYDLVQVLGLNLSNDDELVKDILAIREPMLFQFDAITKFVHSSRVAVEG